MKIRALSPNVVKYVTRKHWYEYVPGLDQFKWKLQELGSWLRGILRRKHHIVRMKALSRGQWYDSDIRIFEANFQILVDYIENECAWMNLIAERKTKWYYNWLGFPDARGNALKHLNWEIQLGKDSPGQSESAEKVKELYLWYKDVRPARLDPWNDVPLREWKTEPTDQGMQRLLPADEDYYEAIQKAAEMEQAYEDEDTQKLVELIRIRQFLWT